MRRLADEQVPVHLHVEFGEPVDFFDQTHRVNHHAIANDAGLPAAQDAGGNQVQHVFLTADENGVSRVVPALGTDHDVRPFRQDVNDLALAFIAPLRAH